MFEGWVVQAYSAYSLLSICLCITRSTSNIHGYHCITNLLGSCCMRGKISTPEPASNRYVRHGDRIRAYGQPESMTVLISWHLRLIGKLILPKEYLFITMALLWSWSSLGQRKIFPTLTTDCTYPCVSFFLYSEQEVTIKNIVLPCRWFI